MLKTLTSLPSIGVVALLSLGIVAATESPRIAANELFRVVNPCSHTYEGTEERLLYTARPFVSESAPGIIGWRSRYGIDQWPADSVVATADSAVGAHLDSLVAAWIETPAAATLGVNRDSLWPGISAVRINPYRYLVSPPLLVEKEWVLYFVVDSLGGGVQFFRTKW
jgi:hypothetical protein